jgi:subtilisin family serine protease
MEMRAKILLVVLLMISGIFVGRIEAQGLERYIVAIQGPTEQASQAIARAGGVVDHIYNIVPAMAIRIPAQAIQGLQRNPLVVRIEPDIQVFAHDAELQDSWGVQHIGAGIVHANGNTGAEIRVAVIDTGIDYTHPDLDGNYIGGHDFVNPDDDPMDDNGHGTHVAGTIAAEDNGSGVVGVAPGAQLYALKVLNSSGSGNIGNIIAALDWCLVGPDGKELNGDEPQVTNNSYGSLQDPGVTFKAAFDAAAAAGIVMVASAGNSGNPPGKGDNVEYPARYASAIAVAATDSSDKRARFSSTGLDVEIAAPGVSIYSTIPGGGHDYKSGTSMASPHVAGTVALMMTGDGYSRAALQSTADDLGPTGWDSKYGYGLVDADEAAGTSVPPDTTPPAAPTGLSATPGDSIVNLDWNNNTETDLESYNVHRSTTSGSGYSPIATGVATSEYVDSTAINGTTYYYVVTAVDTSGNESGYSNEDSATPQASSGGGLMYVSDIQMWHSTAGPNYFIYTRVTIVDETPINLVSEATVYLTTTLPDGSTTSGSGLTSSDGTVTFKIKSRQTGTYTSAVTNVTHASLTYEAGDDWMLHTIE